MQPRRRNWPTAGCHTPSELEGSRLKPRLKRGFLVPVTKRPSRWCRQSHWSVGPHAIRDSKSWPCKDCVQQQIIIFCRRCLRPMMRWPDTPSPGIDLKNVLKTESTRITNHNNQEWWSTFSGILHPKYSSEHQRYQINRYTRRILQQNHWGTGRLDNKKVNIKP